MGNSIFRQSEKLFKTLIEKSMDSIWMIHASGKIIYANPAFEDNLGYDPEQLLGQNYRFALHPEDADRLTALFQELIASKPGTIIRAELRIRHIDGSYRIAEGILSNHLDDPAISAIVVNGRDITERRKLESMVLQSQKMEIVGRLAGGIAHDFNNYLLVLTSNFEKLRNEIEGNSNVFEILDRIDSTTEHATDLINQLLAFSRGHTLSPESVDLNSVVKELEEVISTLLAGNIDYETELEPELYSVEVDRSQIKQVILNLVVNACDAMPGGGKVTIRTRNKQIFGEYSEYAHYLKPGRYVVMEIEDTGQGMNDDIKSHVFEPFFTTKGSDRGTGLGLATVYGIVKQSGGRIHVSSEPDNGANFTICLPEIDNN